MAHNQGSGVRGQGLGGIEHRCIAARPDPRSPIPDPSTGTLVAQTQNSATTRYTQDLAAPLSQVLSNGTQRFVYGMPAEHTTGLGPGVWGLDTPQSALNRSASETLIPKPLTLHRLHRRTAAGQRCVAAGALVRGGQGRVWGDGIPSRVWRRRRIACCITRMGIAIRWSLRNPRGEKPCATPGMSVGQCMEGGSLSFPPPPPPGSHPWDAFVEGVKIALDHEVLCQVTELLDETLKQGATTPESSPDPARPSVVELGYGGRLDNLIALADAYPIAKVYGIDNQNHGSQADIDKAGYRGRIELLRGDYATYPTLQHKVDVVVSVAPNTGAKIAEGIEQMTKPGGVVDILFAQIDRTSYTKLLTKYQNKLTSGERRAPLSKNAPSNIFTTGGDAVDSALGIPLRSVHCHIGAPPWEFYVPSW